MEVLEQIKGLGNLPLIFLGRPDNTARNSS
jgi:hypothetical protein